MYSRQYPHLATIKCQLQMKQMLEWQRSNRCTMTKRIAPIKSLMSLVKPETWNTWAKSRRQDVAWLASRNETTNPDFPVWFMLRFLPRPNQIILLAVRYMRRIMYMNKYPYVTPFWEQKQNTLGGSVTDYPTSSTECASFVQARKSNVPKNRENVSIYRSAERVSRFVGFKVLC